MAVHLNASLETRKIPYLFSALLVVWVWSGHLHADHLRADEEQPEEVVQASTSDDVRRPGFSKITYSEDTIQSGASAAAIAPQLPGMDEVRAETEGPSADSSPVKEE